MTDIAAVFRLPTFDDPDDHRSAWLLDRLIWLTIAVYTLIRIAGFVLQPATASRSVRTLVIICGVSALTFLLLRWRQVLLGSILFAAQFWVVIVIATVNGWGLETPVLPGLVIVVLAAGLLIGWRAGLLASLVCMLTLLAIAYADANQLLLVPPSSPARVNYLLANLQMASLIVTFVYFYTAQNATALAAARRELAQRKQAEEALSASQAQYRLIVETAVEGILVFDRAWRVTFANEQAARMLGYSREEVLGQSIDTFVFPDELPDHRQRQASREQGLTGIREGVYRRKDGTPVWLHLSSTPMMPSGVFAGSFVMTTDITERRAAEAALRDNLALLESAQSLARMGSYTLDLTTRTISLSAALTRLFAAGDSALTLPLEEYRQRFVYPDDRARTTTAAEAAYQTGERLGQESRVVRGDGQTIWIQSRVIVMPSSTHWLGVIQDITERKQAELALTRQTEELARLYRASGSLLSATPLDIPSLARSILSVVTGEFGQTNCSLILIQPESERLVRVAAAGAYADQVVNQELNLSGPGLIPLALRTGQCLNTPDVRESRDYLVGWPEARSELTIPLKLHEQVIGGIDIQSAQVAAFSQDDERLMTIFAERAALALEHARLYSQMAQWLENMTALHAVDAAITGNLDLELTMSMLVDRVRQRLGVTWANVWLYLPASQTFESMARLEPLLDGAQPSEMRLSNSLAGRVVLERRTIAVADLRQAASAGSPRAEALARRGFQAYLGIPLIARGVMKGVLQLYQRGPLALDAEQRRFLELLSDQAAIAIDNAQLFENLQRSNNELQQAYDRTIEGWSQAMDLRDKETEGHTQRVTELVLKLAQAAGLSAEELVQVRRGALLHDVGKLGVPDGILLKPGELTTEEWVIMRQHPAFAYQMLAPIAYLRPALDIPYCHHERWDGTGYPRGLKGEEIPLAARLFAVVDVWDALRSDRAYRASWPAEKVLAHIRERAGTHFDPQAVSLFLSVIGERPNPSYRTLAPSSR